MWGWELVTFAYWLHVWWDILHNIHHTDPPECSSCHQLLFVKHVLNEYVSYNQTQQQCFVHTNIKDIFSYSAMKNILDFIKNVSLYDNLYFLKRKTLIKNNVNL